MHKVVLSRVYYRQTGTSMRDRQSLQYLIGRVFYLQASRLIRNTPSILCGRSLGRRLHQGGMRPRTTVALCEADTVAEGPFPGVK